jgi:large subunit ribosomal protein L17
LQNKEIVSELFRDVAPKIATRDGGYTRIIRTGYRLGDNAEMCMIELVDFNAIYTNEKAKKTTRRSKRAGGKKEDETTVDDTIVSEDVVENEVATETEEPTTEAEENTSSDEETEVK